MSQAVTAFPFAGHFRGGPQIPFVPPCLLQRVRLVEPANFTLPRGIHLPEKDLPILPPAEYPP